MNIKEYISLDICKKCGGECCKRLPAPYSPDDIVKIFGDVDKAIESGKVAIDWWEDSTAKYFLRPKAKNALDKLYDPSWGGECMHLRKNGCELPRNEMPIFCKTLEGKGGGCKDHSEFGDKLTAAKLWEETGINLRKYEEDN